MLFSSFQLMLPALLAFISSVNGAALLPRANASQPTFRIKLTPAIQTSEWSSTPLYLTYNYTLGSTGTSENIIQPDANNATNFTLVDGKLTTTVYNTPTELQMIVPVPGDVGHIYFVPSGKGTPGWTVNGSEIVPTNSSGYIFDYASQNPGQVWHDCVLCRPETLFWESSPNLQGDGQFVKMEQDLV